ncbi:hypothetical protein [Gryllotalpicola protaetiae]|uniref:SprT-like domain-containing protein n=1 Tax=Gryllotalpicola protaetiae TaxID=2419771 RepID=A0A387BWL5_9MICO|nr:hypothetical protein [Gryllotalpicola protaetiae]AYG05540.1 hypothetical protein D7I44_17845 [Gryllotalpicola protaetiae]
MNKGSITAGLVEAIENTWKAIQAQQPDVPEVVVTIGAGSRALGLVLGHFAANRWVAGEEGEQRSIHELFVSGEGLQRGAADVLGTLLHEAAHAAAEARGIKDTSRQGRYHNARFKAIGEEFGLRLEHDKAIGWSTTSLPAETAEGYAEQVHELEGAMVAYRRAEGLAGLIGVLGGNGDEGGNDGEGDDEDKPKKPKNGYSAECECGRKIRVSASTYEAGPILCGLCHSPFTSADAEEGGED